MAIETNIEPFENPLVKDVYTHFRAARNHSSPWRQQSREDYDMVSGEQWTQDDKALLEEQLRPIITFNRIGPIVDAISGMEISNRQEVRYIPREMGDIFVNELFTSAAHWVRDETNADDEETEAFLDTIICGMGWTETYLDYEEDPDGKIIIDRMDPLEMYWDPNAKKKNLTDARWFLRAFRVDKDEFKQQWPDADIDDTPPEPWDDMEEFDQPPHDATDDFRYENDTTPQWDKYKNKVRVLKYQWREKKTFYRVLNPTNGKLEEVSSEVFNKLRDRIEINNIPYVKQKRWECFQAYLAGKQILEEVQCPSLEHFSFKAITGKRDRNRNLWYGYVKSMKDPQRWANKFLSQILQIVNSNAKGGIMAETGAFENPRKAEQDWSSPDSITWLRDGGLGKVKEKDIAKYPTGIDRLMEVAIHSIRDVVGANLEMLGMAERNQPGILEYQRKQSAFNILAGLFDSLKKYRKEQGRLLLDLIQEYITDGRLIKIVGEESGLQQYVPLVRQEETKKYDIIVDDAPQSPNQKEQVWQILRDFLPLMGDSASAIIPEAVKYTPLPPTVALKFQQALAPKPDPTQQQAVILELQEKMANIEKLLSTAELNRAKAASEGQGNGADSAIKIAELQGRQENERTRITGDLALRNKQIELQDNVQKARALTDLNFGKIKAAREQRESDQNIDIKRMAAIGKISNDKANNKSNE